MSRYTGDENTFSRLVDDGDGHMVTVWYEAQEEELEGECKGCALNWDKCSMLKQQGLMPYCTLDTRNDGRDVIWKEAQNE